MNPIIDTYAIAVPSKEYSHPDIQAAMREELEKFEMFDAYEIVDDEGQERIDGRWVVNRKEAHDGLKTAFKARWCLRGFKDITSHEVTLQLRTDFTRKFSTLLLLMKAGCLKCIFTKKRTG